MTFRQDPNHKTESVEAQPSEELDLEKAFEEVEQSLQTLKARYEQIQQGQQEQIQLKQQLDQLQQEVRRSRSPELKADLKRIQERLDKLEVTLESQLLSWSGLKETFWQLVRFGGLGMVLGWFLAFVVLNTPKPLPSPPSSNSPLEQVKP